MTHEKFGYRVRVRLMEHKETLKTAFAVEVVEQIDDNEDIIFSIVTPDRALRSDLVDALGALVERMTGSAPQIYFPLDNSDHE